DINALNHETSPLVENMAPPTPSVFRVVLNLRGLESELEYPVAEIKDPPLIVNCGTSAISE
ncbi:hypothetical protein OFM21_31340, partial [Escherichia coli]|nr:hypothetical protein [Escherichia coli]